MYNYKVIISVGGLSRDKLVQETSRSIDKGTSLLSGKLVNDAKDMSYSR